MKIEKLHLSIPLECMHRNHIKPFKEHGLHINVHSHPTCTIAQDRSFKDIYTFQATHYKKRYR